MFSAEQKAKLTQLVNEGVAVLTEIEDLTGGLNDHQISKKISKESQYY
jgi:hypothetical protein